MLPVRRFPHASHDLEEIRRNVFPPDSLEEGQTLKERLAIVARALPLMTNWDLVIYGFQYEGDKLTVDAEVRNTFGIYPWAMVLKKVDGEWLTFGIRISARVARCFDQRLSDTLACCLLTKHLQTIPEAPR